MLRRFLPTFLLLFALSICSLAAQQNIRCAADEVFQQELATEQGRLAKANFDREIRSWLANHQGDSRAGAAPDYVIPVVFHIVQYSEVDEISDACVQSQLDVMNEDFQLLNSDTSIAVQDWSGEFGNPNIEFCLATVDPNGDPTTGITRTVDSVRTDHNIGDGLKALIQWPPQQYLNVWVPRSIVGGVLGYATLPPTLNSSPQNDGIVLHGQYFGRGSCADAPYDRGRTATHEVGHWLGLYHTFQNGCAGTSATDCATAGDEVCDTPPTASSNFGCPSTQNTCTETPNDLNDQTYNYMDYVDDNCMCMFSHGQSDRMIATLNTTRSVLVSPTNNQATGCNCDENAPCAPQARFGADNTILCPGQTVNFSDQTNGPATTWVWSFPGGSPASATTANPTVTYTTPGTYDVSLTATNSLGTNTAIATGFITVVQPVPPPVIEDFETTFPVDWSIKNPDFSVTWELTDTAAASGSQSMVMDNWLYNAAGSADEIESNIIDLTSYASGELTFAYAYQRASFQFDTFTVYISGDCGDTWDNVWSKSGADLATVSGVAIAAPFYPASPSDWVSDTIDLSPYLNSDGVKFRFENIGWEGNLLFLDNINISALVSAEEAQALPQWSMEIAPNPFQDQFEVQYELQVGGAFELGLYDMTGRALYRTGTPVRSPGRYQVQIPSGISNALAPGMYFVRGQLDGRELTEKVIKLK